jgi:hypothetical protein
MTTHHLLTDIKAAYDTIITNEIYVIMAEIDFPTKLIRLTTFKCCVKYLSRIVVPLVYYKIQKDCSDPFETRQRLRQEDVLSTMLFNVVLEVIVRRAKLQTMGTIFNKQTQLLAYADDIDIVDRSFEGVCDAWRQKQQK